MKTELPIAINTIDEAKAFLKALYDNDETFHPEDDATDLVGDPFTREEGERLNKLMGDIYRFPGNERAQSMVFDPCEYLLELQANNRINRFGQNSNVISMEI